MSDRIRENWAEYQANKMMDPATRYLHSDYDTFAAGWRASEKKTSVAIRKAVWYSTPEDPQEDADA